MAQKQPNWRQRNRKRPIIVGIIIGCLCVIVLIITESMLYGTGFNENITRSISRTIISTTPTSIATPTSITTTEQYQPGKTLWDWMQLLIIPVVLAVAAYLFNLAISSTEHKIAEDKQREDLLQSFLDRMSDLLLKNQLRASRNPQDEQRYIARVRALAALNQLDAKRKRILLQFLHESVLIHSELGCIIQLEGADFSYADLSHLFLENIELIGVNLSHANLHGAYLSHANLNSSNLNDANLAGSNLAGANLSFASLNNTDLSNAFLSNADLSFAKLNGANLSNAIIENCVITQEQLDSLSARPT